MKYGQAEISSARSDDESDEELNFREERRHQEEEVKRIIGTLRHPKESQEFMEHILNQT